MEFFWCAYSGCPFPTGVLTVSPETRKAVRVMFAQPAPVLIGIPARTSCRHCSAADAGWKEAATLLRARGAPGSLPAGLWGAGSTLPRSASSRATGAQQSSLGSPSCKHARRKTSPHKTEWSAWTYWASMGTHTAGNLSYQTSSLEIAWATLLGSHCTLNTNSHVVKTAHLALEEPGPFPVHSSRNLFSGFRVDWDEGNSRDVVLLRRNQLSCIKSVLLEAEIKEKKTRKEQTYICSYVAQ